MRHSKRPHDQVAWDLVRGARVPRKYIKGTWQEHNAFSPAVVTKGGTVIWLAGHANPRDEADKSLADDFEAQVHGTFKFLSETLAKAGGRLQDIVTMTVFLRDARQGPTFLEIRKGYFPEGFPASALITAAGFAVPEMLIEIQAIAVIGDE